MMIIISKCKEGTDYLLLCLYDLLPFSFTLYKAKGY